MTDDKETRDLLQIIDSEAVDLTPWEIRFVADLTDNPPDRFTSRQAEIVRQIHGRRVK